MALPLVLCPRKFSVFMCLSSAVPRNVTVQKHRAAVSGFTQGES